MLVKGLVSELVEHSDFSAQLFNICLFAWASVVMNKLRVLSPQVKHVVPHDVDNFYQYAVDR